MTSLLSQSHTPDEMCTSRRAGEPPPRGPCAAMRHSRRPPVSPTPPSHAGEPRCNSGPAPCPPGRGHPHLSREGARPPSLCFRALLVPHKTLPLCSTCDLTATWWTNSLKLAPMSHPSRGPSPPEAQPPGHYCATASPSSRSPQRAWRLVSCRSLLSFRRGRVTSADFHTPVAPKGLGPACVRVTAE